MQTNFRGRDFIGDLDFTKEEVETVNQADTLVYATEKSLKDFGDKVSQAERADIEAKLNDVKTAIKDKNVDRVKKSTEELTKASHKLAEEVYSKMGKEQAGAGAASGAPGGDGKKPDEKVVDAEFEEVDKDKK